MLLLFFKNNWMPKFNTSLSTTKLIREIYCIYLYLSIKTECITFECFPFIILNDRADFILLQVSLAKSICLSGTRFIHHWKQEGFWTRGRSLRITSYKGIAKRTPIKAQL